MTEPHRRARPSLWRSAATSRWVARGINQVLPHPSETTLYEAHVRDASRYVTLAEARNGSIAAPVGNDYVWGDVLTDLERIQPDLRITNLETSITRSDDYWRSKGIHYRMHPDNMRCLQVPKIDCCVLASNHVLDWGYGGLTETLVSLQ
jgi:poly-gamma-glutamate synthesis protein (capsule biosynthesis protein)